LRTAVIDRLPAELQRRKTEIKNIEIELYGSSTIEFNEFDLLPWNDEPLISRPFKTSDEIHDHMIILEAATEEERTLGIDDAG